RSCSILAVTDFHFEEGTRIARRLRRPLVRLHLRGDFVPALMDAARRGRLAMIVSNPSFYPAFRQTLGHLGLLPEHLEGISVVPGVDRDAVHATFARADFIYISPLCERQWRTLVPLSTRLLSFEHHLADESVEELESWLLLSGAPSGAGPAGSR